jgi:ABC-type branched-subunit amino acid transport system substrate-binding protein
MQAYDAANIVMTAIGNAIKGNGGNMPSRKQVRDEMAKITSFQGVIGNYGFDQNGDTSLKIVSIYVVKTGLSDSDIKSSTGVCGKKAANACFVWKTQFDFAKAS